METETGGAYNLGDYLSLIVFNKMLEYFSVEDMKSFDGKTKHLYCIGSIIDGGYQDAIIWGSGVRLHRKHWWRSIRQLDVRCCMGPLTREILTMNGYDVPCIYGDPAVLMSMIY